MNETKSCPCGIKESYESCCAQYHQQKAKPLTAEALMRSRYCAYAMQSCQYLFDTTLPKSREVDMLSSIEKFAQATNWISLDVLKVVQGQASDKIGKVEFKAFYTSKDGTTGVHHELSRFKKFQGDWYYVDGELF